MLSSDSLNRRTIVATGVTRGQGIVIVLWVGMVPNAPDPVHSTPSA